MFRFYDSTHRFYDGIMRQRRVEYFVCQGPARWKRIRERAGWNSRQVVTWKFLSQTILLCLCGSYLCALLLSITFTWCRKALVLKVLVDKLAKEGETACPSLKLSAKAWGVLKQRSCGDLTQYPNLLPVDRACWRSANPSLCYRCRSGLMIPQGDGP